MADAPLECFFVDASNQQQGPLGSAEIVRLIRNGTIRRDTLIWYTGMQDWRPAGEVSGLASLFAAAGPPARGPGGPPPQAASGAPMQRRAPLAGAYAGSGSQAGSPDAGPDMGFVDAVKICFRKYVEFSGRARRAEYWWFILFYVLLMIVLVILDTVIALIGVPLSVFTTLGSLGMFLPSLSAAVRRLHDTNRSGWLVLLGLIPLVGGIILLIFACQRGTVGPNRFGEDPLSGGVATTFE